MWGGSTFCEEVSAKPYDIFEFPGFNFFVTNSILTSWIVSLLIILIVKLAVGGRPKLIPEKGQAVIESILETIETAIAPIVGRRMVMPTFPLLMGFFIFILIQNWAGLVPGMGALGHYDEHGHFLYYFRPGNADLNMTFALSIISFVAWVYYIFRYAGFKAIAHDLFGNKANKADLSPVMYYSLFLVFLGVGFIEVVSILFRLVSLSFRLFGNVFGGENLITSISGIFGYILPVPFYFLEILIGLIQAFVFTLLTAIYIGLICNHGEATEDGHGH